MQFILEKKGTYIYSIYTLYSGILGKGKQVEENQERRDMTEVNYTWLKEIILETTFYIQDFLGEDTLGKTGLKIWGCVWVFKLKNRWILSKVEMTNHS